MAYSYGEGYIADCRALILARVEALKASMQTSLITPRPVAVHDHHAVARLNLPAVTIGFEGEERMKLVAFNGALGGGTKYGGVSHTLIFTIHVHTDFAGGRQDEVKQARLLTSLGNYLLEKMDLDTAYRIIEISGVRTGLEFQDSATLGAEVAIQVNVMIAHTQEGA